ncbi:MAG: hypothetical protein P4N60_18315 [Verrucomicrobiae bacterium]|nr:hypothetical protein [Verrucomicrobiae bacterium]
MTELAKLLGIDESRAAIGFNYFDAEGEELLPDAAQFLPVGKGALPKEAPADPPADGAPAASILDRFSLEFSLAVGMLTKAWEGDTQKMAEAFGQRLPGVDSQTLLKKLLAGFDKSARDFLKKAELPDGPTFEELKAARDAGPEALAKLLIKRTRRSWAASPTAPSRRSWRPSSPPCWRTGWTQIPRINMAKAC